MSSKLKPCPQCDQPAKLKSDHFPFCSRRCRLLDLGKWLAGDFRVASERVDPEAHQEWMDEES